MHRSGRLRASLVPLGGLLFLACGSRTELPPGRVLGAAGSAGMAGAPASVECSSVADCPPPPPEQCGAAACTDGVCSLKLGQVCNDESPCTTDSCQSGACVFMDARVDADGDGAFASGNLSDPKAALGCGTDCDDAAPMVHPGAVELCDALDNDCNGVIDEGSLLFPAGGGPTQVSPPDADRSWGAGLAFDGQGFGASMTSVAGRTQGQFQQLDARGQLIGGVQRIARVNAEAYGGPLVWSGERYLTAYQDARQDGNYEIYFDLLNRKGERLIEDLRITNADDYSLRPSVLWTGAEGLLIWDDRRFEGSGDGSVIFGQRVSFDGRLIGGNLRLSPPGVRAENAAVALSDHDVGIAFMTLDATDAPRLKFMTASRALDQATAPIDIAFDDPDGPVLTALSDEYVVTFHQDSGVIGPAIYGAVIDQNGVVRAAQSMTAGAAHARGNATFSYGNRFVMVWADDSEGIYQLYAQTFDKKLSPISGRVRITNTTSNTLGPSLAAASDGGLGVLYTDEGEGKTRTFFTRLDCESGPLR
jgi:putative metal-binding protein